MPLTSHLLLDMLYAAGLPKGVVNMVTAEKEEAEVLLRHPAVRGVSFVGTTPVGKHVFGIAASNGKRVQAQTQARQRHALGVLRRLRRAHRPEIISSTFGCRTRSAWPSPRTGGSRCRVADEFVALMKQFALESASWAPPTTRGRSSARSSRRPISSPSCARTTRASREGATLVLDGRGPRRPGFEGGHFVGPTIFDDVTPEMSCGQEEAKILLRSSASPASKRASRS